MKWWIPLLRKKGNLFYYKNLLHKLVKIDWSYFSICFVLIYPVINMPIHYQCFRSSFLYSICFLSYWPVYDKIVKKTCLGFVFQCTYYKTLLALHLLVVIYIDNLWHTLPLNSEKSICLPTYKVSAVFLISYPFM